MAKLLDRFESIDELNKITLEAEEQLILISPYVKLNDELRTVF